MVDKSPLTIESLLPVEAINQAKQSFYALTESRAKSILKSHSLKGLPKNGKQLLLQTNDLWQVNLLNDNGEYKIQIV